MNKTNNKAESNEAIIGLFSKHWMFGVKTNEIYEFLGIEKQVYTNLIGTGEILSENDLWCWHSWLIKVT